MLRKLIVRNLDLHYACCYIYICTVLFVSVKISCVMELLQIKFCIWVFKGGYNFRKGISWRLLFTWVSQELVRHILRKMKSNYGWLFVLRFYGQVNS